MDRPRIGRARPAQPEPRRLQSEHIVSGKIGKHESSGPAAPDGALNDEGDAAATASPS